MSEQAEAKRAVQVQVIDRVVASLAACAAKEDAGYTSPDVEIGPTHARATNGHVALMVPLVTRAQDEFPESAGTLVPLDKPLLIPAAALKTLKFPKRPTLPILADATIQANGGDVAKIGQWNDDLLLETRSVRMGTGRLPDFGHIIAIKGQTRSVTLDAHYLRMLADIAIKARDYKPMMTLTLGEESETQAAGINIPVEGEREITGAIMPIKR